MKQVQITMPRRALTLVCGLALSATAFAQQVIVKGHVKDSAGEPIIGAAVRVNGQSGGAVTDIDGNFSIKADKGATVTVSYVGYEQAQVSVSNNMVITLQEDNQSLKEVVVIGYGRARKTDLTGSVTAIKPDDKNHGLQTNAQDMIQGKIAGVNVTSNDGTPGGGARIRVRGGSSLTASNDPLIVIDGLAMDDKGVKGLANPLSMVNPNDIESFTVLKDASATAIYGSRASNGVIIITTKKGRSGSAPKVSYSGNVSISAKKKTFDVMDGPEYMEFIKGLYGENSEAYNSLGYIDANGNKQYANTDWQDEIYRTAVSTDHNLTVTGGLKNMPYRVSVGYTNNQGIVKTSKFERYTASFNISPTLLEDHLKLNINGKGMIAKNRYADGGAIGAARFMDPTKPVKADNEIYQKYFGGYCQWYSASTYGANWPYTTNRDATKNPVGILDQKNDKANSKSFIGNIEADYSIHGLEDLHLHVNAGMDYSTGKQTTVYGPMAASYENSLPVNYYGYNKWDKRDTYNMQLSMYAQYMKDFNDAHHFDIMAGYEWQKFHEKSDWFGTGYYQNGYLEFDTNRPYNTPSADEITKYETENYLVSFFGRLNYSLLDRYLVTFTIRDDGSSRFHKDNRWGIFPSVALAWKINEEPFMKKLTAVSDMKLRLGWGITGQQNVGGSAGDYYYLDTFTPNKDHAYYPLFGDGTTARPDATNKDLTWEKTTTWNAGLDLGFLNNRLSFSLDWYYRKTKDLINTVYVEAGSTFRNKLTSNIGSLHNTGLEFTTTVRPVQTRDWSWEVSYNLTYNKNEIDELNVGGGNTTVPTGGVSAGTGGYIQAHATGHPASAFYVYQQVYDENGRPIQNAFVDRNGNGTIDSGDKYFYYKPEADVLMGLSSRLTYKNFDFGFSMRASLGNYVYNDNEAGCYNVGKGAIYTLGYAANRTMGALRLNFQSPLTEQAYSDYFVQNASFLKLDNITLGYSFDKLFGAKISGRVYATVQNVLTITDYDGIDPEVAGGIDNNLYPRALTTILGLSLNF
ncbi:MAG: TonB-dependent receptor [Prevotella sp.]|nr:TonB-dependent receptor [Prevotella sp.]